MTTMDAAVPPGGRARPLTAGELTAAWWVGAAAAALGVLGFVNSFRAVARAAMSSFGELAPTVPLGIDLALRRAARCGCPSAPDARLRP